MIALEGMILYSQNKTSKWLHTKSEEGMENLMNTARTLASVYKRKFKARKQAIQEQQVDGLVKKQEAVANKQFKKPRSKKS